MAAGAVFDFKIMLKGGITLLGFLAMIGAAIGDAFTAPDKFGVLFWIGLAAVIVGLILWYFFGRDH